MLGIVGNCNREIPGITTLCPLQLQSWLQLVGCLRKNTLLPLFNSFITPKPHPLTFIHSSIFPPTPFISLKLSSLLVHTVQSHKLILNILSSLTHTAIDQFGHYQPNYLLHPLNTDHAELAQSMMEKLGGNSTDWSSLLCGWTEKWKIRNTFHFQTNVWASPSTLNCCNNDSAFALILWGGILKQDLRAVVQTMYSHGCKIYSFFECMCFNCKKRKIY